MNNEVTILIVKDERIVAKDIQVSLEDLGYQVLGIASCILQHELYKSRLRQ